MFSSRLFKEATWWLLEKAHFSKLFIFTFNTMYVPPIRKRSPEVFPNKFLTEITSDYFAHLKTFEDKSRKEYFQSKWYWDRKLI